MVTVQFHGHLVLQYRACVVDSLGLGITCVFYHCILHSNFYIYLLKEAR